MWKGVITNMKQGSIYTMGVDIGSTSSKAVVIKDGIEIVADCVVQLGTGTVGPQKVLDRIKKENGFDFEQMDYVVATGYGRISFEQADKQISEISCHAKGVKYLLPTASTIIDIGGQDVKAISVGENGMVKKFFMNDKCAAGTGRFLEVMAKILGVDISELAIIDEHAEYVASISSTCTVFAESEVISQLSKSEKVPNIVAGIHQSVASKATALARRCGIEGDVVMTGGVAQNAGVVRALERELREKVRVAPTPQLTGAIGAALFAYEAKMKGMRL